MNTIFKFSTLFLLTVLVFIGFRVFSFAQRMPGDCDEVAYYYWTKYFDAAFLGVPHEEGFWETPDAYDHPNLSRFVFGAYLYALNRDYADRRNALYAAYGIHDICHPLPRDEFMPSIYLMRHVTAAITMVTFVLLTVVVYQITANIYMASLSAVLMSSNDLFIRTMLRATSDGLSAMFALGALVCLLCYQVRAQVWWYVLFAMNVGLSMAAKLIGGIWYVFMMIYLPFEMKVSNGGWIRLVERMCMLFCVSGFFWIVHSPNLRASPGFGTYRYFQTRLQMVQHQAAKTSPDRLPTIPKRLRVSYCLFFQPSCLHPDEAVYLYPASVSSFALVNLVIAFIGICGSIVRIRKTHDRQRLVVLGYGMVTILLTVLINPLAWDRLYLPAVIALHVISMIGIWEILAYGSNRMLRIYA